MSEIKVSQWKCDICGRVYREEKDYRDCMTKHEAEQLIVTVGKRVTVGIARSGQGYMGGPIEFEGYDWVVGEIIRCRDGENGPEALIEYNDERHWQSAYILLEWEREKKVEEYRATHPIDYSKMSSCTVIAKGK